MPCPHGNGPPASCSQCAGAIAKKVAIVNGKMTVEGVATVTAGEHQTHAGEMMLAKRLARKGGMRTCTICEQPGHNRAKCPNR